MAILRLFGAINAGCFLPNFTFQPSLILDLTNLSILVSVLYLFIFISFLSFQKPLLNFESITVYIFISVGLFTLCRVITTTTSGRISCFTWPVGISIASIIRCHNCFLLKLRRRLSAERYLANMVIINLALGQTGTKLGTNRSL